MHAFCLEILWLEGVLLEYGEWRWGRRSRFGPYAGNKANSAAKELNTTNINRNKATNNRKIGLPVNNLFL